MSRTTVIRERLNSMQQDFDDWFSKADENGNAMGPAEIKHVALQQMADKMADMQIIWDGAEEVAPLIKDHTHYTLLKLGNSISTIIPEIRDIYQTFNQFLESGPAENLSTMNPESIELVRTIKTNNNIRFAKDIHESIVNITIARGMLENAHAMLDFQIEIHGKTTSLEQEVSIRELRGLHRTLRDLIDQLKSVQQYGEDLGRLMLSLGSNILSPEVPSPIDLPESPFTESEDGSKRFDNLYFKDAYMFMILLSSVHRAEPILADLMVGLGKITDEHLTRDERAVRGTTLDAVDIARDLHDDIERAYARLDSAANLAARDFQVDYTEADLVRTYGPKRDLTEILQANHMVTKNIQDLLSQVG